MTTEGFGAELLSHQDDDGQWAGGTFFPADFSGDEDTPQPWTATTWALEGTAVKLTSATWEYDDLPYWAPMSTESSTGS